MVIKYLLAHLSGCSCLRMPRHSGGFVAAGDLDFRFVLPALAAFYFGTNSPNAQVQPRMINKKATSSVNVGVKRVSQARRAALIH
jgi:hypothetical protein